MTWGLTNLLGNDSFELNLTGRVEPRPGRVSAGGMVDAWIINAHWIPTLGELAGSSGSSDHDGVGITAGVSPPGW